MALCRAVIDGEVEIVREMLARGEDPNELDAPGGLNAIECAMAMLNHRRRPEDADAVRDLYACIELCLDAGALPDATGRARGNTPLSLAVELGRPDFVRLFLSSGADPNARAASGNGDTTRRRSRRRSRRSSRRTSPRKSSRASSPSGPTRASTLRRPLSPRGPRRRIPGPTRAICYEISAGQLGPKHDTQWLTMDDG